jgi:nitroimidazol reductase NimA-like FMN-containing flavoprotein (pyridoxamine 5'-phosphate oxidase superfamily)
MRQGPSALNLTGLLRNRRPMDDKQLLNQPSAASTRTEVLSVPDCWALLREQSVGRLAVDHDGRPDIFPVNYAVDHGTVVFRTGSGSLFASSAGAWVAFEVDGYDVAAATAWSVVIRGTAQEVRELDDVVDLLAMPLLPWHPGPKPRLVRVEPDSVTGRRFVVDGGFRVAASDDRESAT